VFGVSVKLHPSMYVVTHYAPASREERDALVRHPSVWWYLFDDSDDWNWHRGGAWNAQQGQGPQENEDHIGNALPAGPVAGPVYEHQVREQAVPRPWPPSDEEEDGDDGRW
jgi:hypothetical protein